MTVSEHWEAWSVGFGLLLIFGGWLVLAWIVEAPLGIWRTLRRWWRNAR